MDYKDFSIPFIDNLSIKDSADAFRNKYWNNTVPVDIEKIIDFKMGINIIPSPGLQILCDVDALIYSDWKSIIVDYNKYFDDRYQNRLRFSYAHEIGHFILHKNIHKSLNIKSINDFQKFIKEIPQIQYAHLETQANKFANYLLIPRERLVIEKEKIIKIKEINDLINSGKLDNKTVNPYLAIPLSKIFGVSLDAMEIALDGI
jgi:hypothetical protein